MRRQTPLLLLCAAVCCLSFARKANADVYVDSFVEFDDENGMVYGTVAASVSYDYGYYYSTQLRAYLKAPRTSMPPKSMLSLAEAMAH